VANHRKKATKRLALFSDKKLSYLCGSSALAPSTQKETTMLAQDIIAFFASRFRR